MLRFSIIIVTWNALEHLKTFLPSVAETDYENFEIILADNASTDESVRWVKETYPAVKIVTFDDNYGYCGGNNRAVPYATGDILLFLNNDVKVEPDWLQPLAELFNRKPDIAAAQPKLLSYREPDMFEYAGAAGGFIDRFGYPFCRGRLFDTIEKDNGQYNDYAPIFWASGAALAVRKDIFWNLGGFDEDFEFHMEEIDLCWRLWNSGYKVAFCYPSVVYHLGGGSLPTHSPRKLYYNYRNSLMMLYKNYPLNSLLLKFPARMILDGVAGLKSLLSGAPAECLAIIKAHWRFYSMIPQINRKRRSIQKDLKRQTPLKPISVVWQYFIKNVSNFSDLPD